MDEEDHEREARAAAEQAVSEEMRGVVDVTEVPREHASRRVGHHEGTVHATQCDGGEVRGEELVLDGGVRLAGEVGGDVGEEGEQENYQLVCLEAREGCDMRGRRGGSFRGWPRRRGRGSRARRARDGGERQEFGLGILKLKLR